MSDQLEEGFYQAMHDDPSDVTPWHALHDWLEEQGDPRVDFARLQLHLRGVPVGERAEVERRVAGLIEQGHLPCVPVLTNSIGMRLALIPAWAFLMGSPEDEAGRSPDEGPRFEAKVARPFYLGVHPVTQAQWQAVMGSNPSGFSASGECKDLVRGMDTSDFPVEWVSWEDAGEFAGKLSERDLGAKPGWWYHLPSEEEWEYACRGGASVYQAFHFGNALSSTQANFDGNFPYGQAARGPNLGRPTAVGSYRPNAFGLYDMHGNVWEWCSGWYETPYGLRAAGISLPGSFVALRGGSCYEPGQRCRSACRISEYDAGHKGIDMGFRLALFPPVDE